MRAQVQYAETPTARIRRGGRESAIKVPIGHAREHHGAGDSGHATALALQDALLSGAGTVSDDSALEAAVADGLWHSWLVGESWELPPPLPWEKAGNPRPLRPPPTPEAEKRLAVLCYLTFFFGCVVVSSAVYVNYYRESPYLRYHAGNAANTQLTFLLLWLFLFANAMARAVLPGPMEPWLLGMLVSFAVFLPIAIVGAVLAARGRQLAWPVRAPFSRHRLEA